MTTNDGTDLLVFKKNYTKDTAMNCMRFLSEINLRNEQTEQPY